MVGHAPSSNMDKDPRLRHFGRLAALVAVLWGVWSTLVVLGLAAWGEEELSAALIIPILSMWFWPVLLIVVVGLLTQWAMIRFNKPSLSRIFYGFLVLLVVGFLALIMLV